MTSASNIQECTGSAIGTGNSTPRLLMKTPGSGSQAWRGAGARIGVGRRVGDQRFADAKGRFAVEKAEPAGDVLAAQVDERVVDQKGGERRDDGDEQNLIEDAANAGIVPGRGAMRPGDAGGRFDRHDAPLAAPLSGSESRRADRP